MRNFLKYMGMSLLLLSLVGCDQKSDEEKAQTSAQKISLFNNKLSFTLPNDLSDKSGKIGNSTSNMHVYSDKGGERAVIVIEGEETSEKLDVLASRLEEQQRNRDPQLQVVANRELDLNGKKAQRLDTVISTNQQSAWSSIILAKVDGKLITLQITLPADNQQKAQAEAGKMISSITLD